LAKIEASGSVVFGISTDSMPANGVFAKQIGVTFPLLSDMNRTVMTEYGILKKYPMGGNSYEWARRTTFVVDKQGRIKHIEFDESAINPNTAVAICTGLGPKK
jgi:peroxiredoxin Q/BCP